MAQLTKVGYRFHMDELIGILPFRITWKKWRAKVRHLLYYLALNFQLALKLALICAFNMNIDDYLMISI